MWDDYLFPSSVDEALEMLDAHGGEARIIAGGTDLALQSQRGQNPARVMVDITRIPGLDQIEERDSYVHIDAQVTHAQVAASPLVRARGMVLAEACGSVGGPPMRAARSPGRARALRRGRARSSRPTSPSQPQ